jgi:6-phosphogluconolactonase
MPSAANRAPFVYVGGYTGFGPNARGNGSGIEVFRLNRETGALTHLGTKAGVENPSFLTVDQSQRFLYAVNGSPTIDGHPGGAVTALAIAPATGLLGDLNRQYTTGQGPCHVAVDRARTYVIATSYHTGSVVVFPVQPDGSLAPASDLVQHHGSSVNPQRQAGPHAHSVTFDPAERFCLVCDLGLDRVFVYSLDRASGKLLPNEPPYVATTPGAGPRHLAFHPNGRIVFVINEMGNTITSYHYAGERGTLSPIESVPTLPPDFTGENTTADIHVAPSGRFVYGSNRGHDSIVIYAFDEAAARLSYVGHEPTGGRTPRNFTLSRDGSLLLAANQDSDNVVAFRVDQTRGLLTPTGGVAASPSPTCVRIVE